VKLLLVLVLVLLVLVLLVLLVLVLVLVLMLVLALLLLVLLLLLLVVVVLVANAGQSERLKMLRSASSSFYSSSSCCCCCCCCWMKGERTGIVAVKKEGDRPLILNDLGGGRGNYRVGRSETAGKHVPCASWWDAGRGRKRD